jgi:hypothetical protein
MLTAKNYVNMMKYKPDVGLENIYIHRFCNLMIVAMCYKIYKADV